MHGGAAGGFPVADEFDEADMEDEAFQKFRIGDFSAVPAGSEVHGW